YNANVHRGIYKLGVHSTELYEGAREKVAAFIGAKDSKQIVFTSGSTAALNLVAASYGLTHLGPGDEILTTVAEHHSNLIPWQQIAKKTGATLRFLELDDQGNLSLAAAKRAITTATKVLTV